MPALSSRGDSKGVRNVSVEGKEAWGRSNGDDRPHGVWRDLVQETCVVFKKGRRSGRQADHPAARQSRDNRPHACGGASSFRAAGVAAMPAFRRPRTCPPGGCRRCRRQRASPVATFIGHSAIDPAFRQPHYRPLFSTSHRPVCHKRHLPRTTTGFRRRFRIIADAVTNCCRDQEMAPSLLPPSESIA